MMLLLATAVAATAADASGGAVVLARRNRRWRRLLSAMVPNWRLIVRELELLLLLVNGNGGEKGGLEIYLNHLYKRFWDFFSIISFEKF